MTKNLCVLLLIILASCSRPHVYSDYDHSVDFTEYKTYAWLPNPLDSYSNNMFNNQIVENNIKNYASRELDKRGYAVSTNQPDLLIEYNLAIEKKERTVHTPLYDYPYNYNWNSYPYYDPYRRYMYGFGPPPYISGYESETIPYTEGTLTISVIDRKTNTLIWRGWNIEKVSDPETFGATLQKDISFIFKRFPVELKR